MRLTQQLCAQHLGFMFKRHWLVQGRRIPIDLGTEAELTKQGIKFVDAFDVIKKKPKFERFEIPHGNDIFKKQHTVYHSEQRLVFRNKNVLLEGLAQAQVLTKTLEITALPKQLEETIADAKIPVNNNKNVQNAILASHVFDAEQKKTAKVKDPQRPAFVLPRNYGITDARKSRLILSKLLLECEKLAGNSLNAQRKTLNNAKFIATIEKDSELIQFEIDAEILVTSKRPIDAIEEEYDRQIPDLYPVHHTITIPLSNLYEDEESYPVAKQLEFSNPHTILLHYSPLHVKNAHETPVTETQFNSRTLLKAFAVAVSRAKQLYGNITTDLPKPIVVQSVQTDGKEFHFGVFQLNTLDLNGTEGTKNYWFHVPKMNLFDECTYKVGKPALSGYNPEVLKYFNAFYRN